uniref:Helicase C-terminal domain-containing protein n=1 Tax=Pinguiococcus pyrenoidosus TaxID=172671 RepID=A0A7R9U1U5_9STRA
MKARLGGPHFKAGTRIIVTRHDVIRGIHLDEVPLVIIFDQPKSVDDYFHIAGRTGRQGKRGKVVTLCNYWDAKGMLSWQSMMGTKFEVLNGDRMAES